MDTRGSDLVAAQIAGAEKMDALGRAEDGGALGKGNTAGQTAREGTPGSKSVFEKKKTESKAEGPLSIT